MTATRKIEVLRTLADRRDASLADLQRAFPHGRPVACPQGFDDRLAIYRDYEAQCDAVAKEIYELLGAE